MKVDTDLKSGNVITDAADLVSQGTTKAADFVASADQQARSVSANVTNTAQSAWNSLTGWLRLW